MRLAAVLAAFAVCLAGCSGAPDDGGPGPGVDADPSPAAPEPSVQTFAFTLGAGAGLPVGGPILPADDGRRTAFEVPEGHAHLAATASWECDVDVLCELELELRRGEQDLMTSDFGPSPLALEVDGPPEGRWTFWAFPSSEGSLVVGVEGTLTVSLS